MRINIQHRAGVLRWVWVREKSNDRDQFARLVAAGKEKPDGLKERPPVSIQQGMNTLEQADRRHRRDILAELKQLRADAKLMHDDAAV